MCGIHNVKKMLLRYC